MKSRHWRRAVIILASISAVAAALAYFADGGWMKYMPAPYAYADQPLVDRALDIYGGGTRSRKELLQKVYPVVVRLPEMTCVGLNPRRGRMATATTICFRDADGEVAFSHDA